MSACQRCQKNNAALAFAESDLLGLAKRIARSPENARLRELTLKAKRAVADAKAQITDGHDCDDLASSTRKGTHYVPGMGYVR